MLELNNNRLKQVHTGAFLPIRSTIYDLNLSHNQQLTKLSSIGLELLVSFKAFGNQQLRQLPHFKSAESLALTYAYHCCDYLVQPNLAADSEQQRRKQDDHQTVIWQIFQTILGRFRNLFAADELTVDEQVSDLKLSTYGDDGRASTSTIMTSNNDLNEMILWPGGRRPALAGSQSVELNRWRTEVLAVKRSQSNWKRTLGSSNESELALVTSHRQQQQQQQPSSSATRRRRRQHPVKRNSIYNNAHLIDELVWELKQIRQAHSILLPLNQILSITTPASSTTGTQDALSVQQTDDYSSSQDLNEPPLEDPSLSSDLVARKLLLTLAKTPQQRAKRHHHHHHHHLNTKPIQCLPEPSAFLPCQDLFDTWWLRVGIWCVFLLAFAGNTLVIIVLSSVRQSSSASALSSIMWLAHSKRHIDVPRFLVINLAIADLLMALYLGLLAFVDLSTLGEFKLFAIKWQYSNGCKLASFLGVLSSELSVFILAIITLERNYAITNAVHLNRRLSLQKAMVIMFVGYTFALGMAIMPLNGISDYRKFSICLPLDMDSNLASQVYVITLIGINTFSFILLLSCYLRMYCAIRGSQAWNTNDLRIAKRMSILVLTDFLCWMPIIVVALASLFGHHLIGTNGIKILTIFILPLNSVANPFLYAITTKKFKRDLNTLMRRIKSVASLDCNKPDKDPKLFIGYNQQQYQNNLLMNKSRLAVSSAGVVRVQTSGRIRYARPQTANQVTMNRTTCSCQRIVAQREDLVQPNVDKTIQKQHQQPISRPRIILDSEEPSAYVALAPCGFVRKSLSTNSCLLPAASGEGRLMTERHNRLKLSSDISIVDHNKNVGLGAPVLADVHNQTKSIGSMLNEQQLHERHNNSDRQGFLKVIDSMGQTNRSASACGYHKADNDIDNLSANRKKESKVTGSYDTVRQPHRSADRSAEKLSNSINRLLFGPIAKAWSSIQISLNSSTTQMTVAQQQVSSATNKSDLQDRTTLTSMMHRINEPVIQTYVDDTLLINSPLASRMARLSERRMSRSCDMITQHNLASPTSSGFNDGTTTSQYEHDDDQRILLATINRMAANRLPVQDEHLLGRFQYSRGRCTRCRSWSPALLSKLEDCMHQIKSRIPGLPGFNVGSDDHLGAHEIMHQDEESRDSTTNVGTHVDRAGDCGGSSGSCGGEGGDEMSGGKNGSSNGENSDDEDDEFNERGLLEWSEKQNRLVRRYHVRGQLNKRLQQQSSTNSDTLSTRTAGTNLTNISVSFDSNTNIPVVDGNEQTLADGLSNHRSGEEVDENA